jgi:hypothetical protein
MEARWPACRGYLAGVAWPALRLRIDNEAESFLTDVQVILTFHGARGIDFEGLADFEFEKVRDPSWKPPSDPRFPNIVAVRMPRLARPSDYPIEWRHDDAGDLEVTVTLPRLRPHPSGAAKPTAMTSCSLWTPMWTSTRSRSPTRRPLTATARRGDPFTVPVDKIAMLDVLIDVMEATREVS